MHIYLYLEKNKVISSHTSYYWLVGYLIIRMDLKMFPHAISHSSSTINQIVTATLSVTKAGGAWEEQPTLTQRDTAYTFFLNARNKVSNKSNQNAKIGSEERVRVSWALWRNHFKSKTIYFTKTEC